MLPSEEQTGVALLSLISEQVHWCWIYDLIEHFFFPQVSMEPKHEAVILKGELNNTQPALFLILRRMGSTFSWCSYTVICPPNNEKENTAEKGMKSDVIEKATSYFLHHYKV